MNTILDAIRSELTNTLHKRNINYTVYLAGESVLITVKINLKTTALEKTYLIEKNVDNELEYVLKYDTNIIKTTMPVPTIYNNIRQLEIRYRNA